ncbi:hypothetical protein [Chitinophaga qingshengii]|uniref:Uncharacterized protein n=1 Tax=Chitinophaga qingshengii TaxID=1569794 RepID=A0ABR7TMD3_9BACT|nr:hypothetical protein [Chitinophaga qingshengii]MBC9931641.1 hypothetical protein [Chitinophaga qingshengii]
MNRWILGCWLLSGPVYVQAQVSAAKMMEVPPQRVSLAFPAQAGKPVLSFPGLLSIKGTSNRFPLVHLASATVAGSPKQIPPPPVYLMTPHSYYDQHFGFFCKQEWSWQKQTGIPVKIRLGSYDLTQRQEGK